MARTPRASKKPAGEPAPSAPEPPKIQRRTPEIEIALGARIRAARMAAGVSRIAVGKTLGVSWQQVQKYEAGKDRIPATILQRIAAALGVHPGSFFDADMQGPVGGSIVAIRRAVRAAEVLGQIRDLRVLKQFVALAKALAETENAAPATDSDGTP